MKNNALPSVHKWADKLIESGASWDTFRREPDDIIADLAAEGIPRLAARDICNVAAEALSRSEAPLSIFWDLENVPIPSSISGTQVATRLKSILAPHGQIKQFRGYASIGLNLIPERKRSELQLSGCHLVDCPHNGRKEVADKMIIVDGMEFAFMHPDGATLCFITGDVDYAYLLAKLQKPQWTTIVISKGTMQSMLHVNCDMKMRWETDVLQLRSTPVRTRRDVTDVQTFASAVGSRTAETVDLSSVDDGFIDCNGSVSSFEALTTAEEWTDDVELLRSIVADGSHVGGSSPGTLKAHVGNMLRQTNPARFSDRSTVQSFLAKAINEGVVIETGDGGDKALHISSEFNGSAQPAVSLSEEAPLNMEDMPERALSLSKTMPFILFVEKYRIPSGSKPPGFVQSTDKYIVLMFDNLTDAQREAASTPWLRDGVLVDWRRAKQPQKKTIADTLIETFRCASCDGLCLKSNLFAKPGTEGLLCRTCFESADFWTHSEASKAQDKVVELLNMMADNDDVYVPRNILRKVLNARWPIECASRGQAALWIEGAIETGAVIEMKRPDTKTKVVFLPKNHTLAMAPFPRNDIDTSAEERFVEDMLWNSGGSVDRKKVNSALAEEFPRMSTPMMRTKMYLNAFANRAFFVNKGPKGQAVGLKKEDATAALDVAAEDILSTAETSTKSLAEASIACSHESASSASLSDDEDLQRIINRF